MTAHTLVGGQVLSNTHSSDRCAGEFCCIHNPSDHPMVEWDQLWLSGMMYRVSPDGDLYPDPDSPSQPERPNAARCLGCDTVIVSLHRHDFRICDCSFSIMVDGGYVYSRRGWRGGTPEQKFEDIEEWPIRKEWLE